jgi:hypothetical protein
MLVNVLFAIADLNYSFHLGAMSPEYCYRCYEDCFGTTEKTIEKIKQWHLDFITKPMHVKPIYDNGIFNVCYVKKNAVI